MKLIAAILIIASFAFAESETDFVKFDKWYGLFTVHSCAFANFSDGFNIQKEKIQESKGIIFDFRECVEADSQMFSILGRLTHHALEADWTRVEPQGDWQYTKPVVLMVRESWKESMLIEMFNTHREYVELETSGDVDKAKKRLKKLVRKKELQERNRLERMFEGKKSGKVTSPIATPSTPTK